MVCARIFGTIPMRITLALILIAAALTCVVTSSQSESPRIIGRWKVDITFANGESRLVGFEAQGAGQGFFRLLDPQSKVWMPANPSKAKWVQGEGNAVTFSGPIEFPLGNVGRDPGTLVFKGKLEADGSLRGEVTFSSVIEEKPSKRGTFKAVPVAGG